MKKITWRYITAITLPLILTACGSSGSSAPSGPSALINDNLKQQIYQSKLYDIGWGKAYQFNGKNYAANEEADFSSFPINTVSSAPVRFNDGTTGTMKIYNQTYSIVIATGTPIGYGINTHRGLQTPLTALPTGTVKYAGLAFDQNNTGTMEYTIDFAAKTGSGKVTGFSGHETIFLNNTSFYGREIDGTAQSSLGTGFYNIRIYGPKGEEIAGSVRIGGVPNGDIGFGGRR